MAIIGVGLGFAVFPALFRQNPFLVPAFLQTCLCQPAVYFLRVRISLLVEDAQTLGDCCRRHIAGCGLCRATDVLDRRLDKACPIMR